MQTYRRAITPILITALAFASAAATTAPAAAKSDTKHDRIVAYWTPAKMRNAKPRDFVRGTDGKFKPAKRHNKGGPPGSGGGSTTVTGSSWNKGGDIVDASGALFFTLGSTNYRCSASVVNDNTAGRAILLTAGHCAYDWGTGWATNVMFIPAYDVSPTRTCSRTALGCWTASALVIDQSFMDAGGFNVQAVGSDWAFLVVKPQNNNQLLDNLVNEPTIAFDTVPQRTYAFGYPAQGKYKGNDLVYCAGTSFYDANTSNATVGLGCKMTGGASGGPWLRSFDEKTGNGTTDSLNSYKYVGQNDVMYGPVFDGDTATSFGAAKLASHNEAT